MKNILCSVIVFCISLCANAQVSYGDTFWGTSNMKINVVTENDSTFLYLIFTSEKRQLTDTPKLLIRLMDDTVISLEGKNLGNYQKDDGGVMVYGVFIADKHFVSEAKFPISKEEILSFEKGVKKLRLNTSPKYHEKSWSSDKIGKKLYKAYIKSSPNSFEDDF